MASHVAAPMAATTPEVSKALAAEAYVWGLAPEFNLRFSTYQGTAPLDGNNTYSITFPPPETAGGALPAVGIFPPLVEDDQGTTRLPESYIPPPLVIVG